MVLVRRSTLPHFKEQLPVVEFRRIIRQACFDENILTGIEMGLFLDKLHIAGGHALRTGNGLIKYQDFIWSIEKLPNFSVHVLETSWPYGVRQ